MATPEQLFLQFSAISDVGRTRKNNQDSGYAGPWLLTVCDGRIVYSAGEFASLAPPLPAVSPDWAPTARYGGYANEAPAATAHDHAPVFGADGRLWEMGCGCAV